MFIIRSSSVLILIALFFNLSFTAEVGRIPFKLTRNKIILPVRVNESRTLDLILDTVMPSSGLLLFNKKLGQELGLTGTRQFQIQGAGEGQGTNAIMVESVRLTMAETNFLEQDVLVIQSDTMTGFATDGVIGYTLFGSYVVKIDYDIKTIILFETEGFEPSAGWESLELDFKNERKIPWVKVVISVDLKNDFSAECYIDSASSEALELLIKSDMKYTLPEGLDTRYLGKGLSGHIFGKYGTVAGLKLGSYQLINVPTAFPEKEIRSKQAGADGIICNNTLRRFNLIFDYARSRLYIIPNLTFSQPFTDGQNSLN